MRSSTFTIPANGTQDFILDLYLTPQAVSIALGGATIANALVGPLDGLVVTTAPALTNSSFTNTAFSGLRFTAGGTAATVTVNQAGIR